MSSAHDPNIPYLCLLGDSRYGQVFRQHYPRRTKYTDCIAKRYGRRVKPLLGGCKGAKGCAKRYIDINGVEKSIDFRFPYVLAYYGPLAPVERYFQTKERAMVEAPRCGDWEIMHLPSGQVVAQPGRP